MASKFRRFKDGDALTPTVMNSIFAELDRWRGLTGSGLIGVDGAGGNAPPRIVDHRGSPLLPAQLGATLATGTIGSPSSAAMTLLKPTGSAGGLTATGGTTGLSVYNFWTLSSSLASGTTVLVFPFAGKYYLAQASC